MTFISALEDQVSPLPSLSHQPTLQYSLPIVGTEVLHAVYCAVEGVRGIEGKSG